MIHQKVGQYFIESILGQGGMATVYLARDLNLDTHVALKILNTEYAVQPNIRKRFIAEARSMFRMSHENIVRVYALVETEEAVAIAMEYIEGQTLRQCMLNEGRLPDDKIRAFLRQILGALRYVHSQQLVHRDIKPGNFMVDKQGNIKLMDFGIAKSLDARSADYTETGSGVQMGTPMYMSPEQITSSHAVTAQSDLYSLGVVLWELASGQRPYDSKSLSIPEIQVKVIKEPLPMLNSVWDYHIQKVTAKVPAGRYRSSQEWLLNLDRLEDTVPVEPPIAPSGGVTKGSATKGLYWIFGAACLFFLLVFFVSRNSNSSMEEDPIPFEVDVEVDVDTTAVQEAPAF
jgi:serine/threonine protein kinase